MGSIDIIETIKKLLALQDGDKINIKVNYELSDRFNGEYRIQYYVDEIMAVGEEEGFIFIRLIECIIDGSVEIEFI